MNHFILTQPQNFSTIVLLLIPDHSQGYWTAFARRKNLNITTLLWWGSVSAITAEPGSLNLWALTRPKGGAGGKPNAIVVLGVRRLRVDGYFTAFYELRHKQVKQLQPAKLMKSPLANKQAANDASSSEIISICQNIPRTHLTLWITQRGDTIRTKYCFGELLSELCLQTGLTFFGENYKYFKECFCCLCPSDMWLMVDKGSEKLIHTILKWHNHFKTLDNACNDYIKRIVHQNF